LSEPTEPVPSPPPSRRFRLRTAVQVAACVLLTLVALAVVFVVGARVVVRGARFGRLIESTLPPMRGRVHIGGGRWTWSGAWELWRGRPAPVEIDDLRVLDPEGTEVLRIRRATARLEVNRGWHRVAIHDLRLEDGAWLLAPMRAENHLGFFAAFQSTQPARGPARAAGGSAEMVIEGARLEGVTTRYDFSSWGLVLNDAHADAALAMRSGPGVTAPFTFKVSNAWVPGGGQLRILSRRSGFLLPFSRGRIEEVGTSDTEPDTLQLRASDVVVGRSTLALAAAFPGLFGVSPTSRAAGMTLDATVTDAADALDALATSRRPGMKIPAGPGARFALRLDGTFDHMRAETTLTSPALGRFDASVDDSQKRVAGRMSFVRFNLGPFLPLPLVPFATGVLDGSVVGAIGADGSLSLDELSLLLTRPPNLGVPHYVRATAGKSPGGPKGPRAWTLDVSGVRYAQGTIRLPRLAFELQGGRFTASGQVALRDARAARWLPTPIVDLEFAARGFSIETLLRQPFIRGRGDFRARVRGPLDDLDADVVIPPPAALSVLDERITLPDRVRVHLSDDVMTFDRLRLGGPRGSTLDASGQVSLDGHLGIAVAVRDFPVDRLPGLVQTHLPIAGRISGDLKLSGGPEAPSISGLLTLGPVTFQGRSIGGGSLAVSPGPRGAIHARGQVVEGISVEGTLSPTDAGLGGEATLDLDRLRLDPFLSALPGGISAAGVLSGRVVARLAPHEQPQAEGWLSELTLVVSPPASRRAVIRPLELHAEREIHLSARSGDGPVEIGPARFRGNLGAFELSGESRKSDVRATLRGRVQLAPFAGLAAQWLSSVSGAVDVDLTAARKGPAGKPGVSGTVSVASPLAFRLAALPLEMRAASGRIVVRGSSIETQGFPVSVRGDRLASGAIRRLEADVRVNARAGGTPGDPHLQTGIAVDRLSLEVPALGSQPVVCERGTIALRGRGDTFQIVDVDLPAHGAVRDLTVSGARIGQARFALRLRGDPQRQLALSGEVELDAARVQATALRAQGAGKVGGAGGKGTTSMLDRPEVANTALDVSVRSRGGAVVVDVPKIPDLRLDLDMHVGGTVKHPAITGEPTGANVYSSFVLGLAKLFR